MRYIRLFLAILAAFIPVSLAQAEQTPTWTNEDLARFASVVITGRVVDSIAAWDPAVRGIYTYTTIEVGEVWKGSIDSDRVVIKTLGGRIDDLELFVDGQATFTVNTDVLLFLEVRPRDGTLYPAGLAQGVRQLTGAQPLALSSVRALVEASASPQSGPITITPPEFSEPLAFTLLPVEQGDPGRWHDSDAGIPVYVDYDGLGFQQISAAVDAWNASGMALQLRLGVTRTARCIATFEGDGRISITFNDPCGELVDDGSIVGMGGGYRTPGDRRTINGTSFEKLVQGIVVLNNSASALSLGCLQDAIAHNVGHAIGLGHATTETAIMSPVPLPGCNTGPSPFGADDITGARFIYPFGVGAGVPGTPTNFRSTVSGTTVTLSWTAPLTGGAVTTWIIEAGSASGLRNLAVVPTGSAQPTITFGGVPSGYYYLRVRGQNALGQGPVSNEIEVAVNCPSPLPPQNFQHTVGAGRIVTFSWAPPASGVVLAYRAEFGSAAGLANLLIAEVPPSVLGGSIPAPPGTYYVRLRTRGTCGLSPPATELTVVVP